MDFAVICAAYGWDDVRTVAPLAPGTTARVWRLETEQGSFLLRTVTEEQGQREWEIYRRLTECGFCRTAEIMTTMEGEPVVKTAEGCYQMQRHLSGAMPDPSQPGVAAAMAATLKALAPCMPDRMIHGDLGPWNMLCREDGTIFVIDFGAARAGDPYFDFAAALGGIINHTGEETRVRACRAFLEELDADHTRLLAQLRLWAEEGITRWSGQSEKMTARFYHALTWAEENLYAL